MGQFLMGVKAAASGNSLHSFLKTKAGLPSSDRSTMSSSTGKEDSAEFRGLLYPASLGSSHMSPFQFLGSFSFSITSP